MPYATQALMRVFWHDFFIWYVLHQLVVFKH